MFYILPSNYFLSYNKLNFADKFIPYFFYVKHLIFCNQSPDQDPTTTPLIGSPTHVIISPSQYKKPPHRSDSLHGLKRQLTGTHTHSHLKHLRLHRNSVMYRGAMMNIHKYRMRASSCPNIYKNSMTTLAKENEEVRFCFCFVFYHRFLYIEHFGWV